MRPYGVWARHQPRSTTRPRCPAAPPARRWPRGTPSWSSRLRRAWARAGDRPRLLDAGLPLGVLHVVTGGDEVGGERSSPIRASTAPRSRVLAVGMELYRGFAPAYPRPVICEMGGKNPVIVSRHADLDLAAEGTARSAFGLSGQKCSAASRVYVERSVADAFVERLVEPRRAIEPADPRLRTTYMGPVIDADAVDRFERAIREADGTGAVLAGGRPVHRWRSRSGHFVAPTVVRVPLELAVVDRAVRSAGRRRGRRRPRRGARPWRTTRRSG